MKCPTCNGEVLDIDVKCEHCGAALGATGAHRMLGQLVLGTYELVDVLGQGGMSVVFKARHKMTEQEVALKILPPELAAHSQVKSRFLEEAKALAALDHPNIVHLYNFGQENGSFVLAMQYVQGKTWERIIIENKRLEWKASVRVAIDVLKALEYAHGRGIVHRDMKPSNVLVRAHDAMATVMDFGIAKMTTSTKLTATGQTMGTVRYMSPEQVRGQEVDLRTDIYSLGATLYESLTGDTPFDGSTHFEIMTKHLSEAPRPPSHLGVELPALVEEAVMHSLAKRAEDRYDTARDMRKLLESALREGDVGLVETQRLGRDAVSELRPSVSKPGMNATPPATASELADELEPGNTGAKPRRSSRRTWPWIVALVAVLGGGGTAAALLLGSHGPPAYKSAASIRGVTLTEGKTYNDLHVLVETDGKIHPDDVIAAYRTVLGDLVRFQPEVTAHREVLVEIVAVPPQAMCEPTLVRMAQAPADCSHELAASVVGIGSTNTLLVTDDRADLPSAMRMGVAGAVCEFQGDYASGSKQDAICKMTREFAQRP